VKPRSKYFKVFQSVFVQVGPTAIQLLQFTIDIKWGVRLLTGSTARRNQMHAIWAGVARSQKIGSQQAAALSAAPASQTQKTEQQVGAVWLFGLGIRAPWFWARRHFHLR
jgi:hypothetical protein